MHVLPYEVPRPKKLGQTAQEKLELAAIISKFLVDNRLSKNEFKDVVAIVLRTY